MRRTGGEQNATTAPFGQWSRSSRAEADSALALALLVMRAGAKDSLDWWDDWALTEAGSYALARIFPRNPGRIALRLAFRAARERHAGALAAGGVRAGTTLFDLTEPLVESISSTVPAAYGPIASMEEFCRRLVALAPGLEGLSLPRPDASGLLDLTALLGRHREAPASLAATLAAGYLGAQKGRPVFPFVRFAGEGSR